MTYQEEIDLILEKYRATSIISEDDAQLLWLYEQLLLMEKEKKIPKINWFKEGF
jgi:hypothetical protein